MLSFAQSVKKDSQSTSSASSNQQNPIFQKSEQDTADLVDIQFPLDDATIPLGNAPLSAKSTSSNQFSSGLFLSSTDLGTFENTWRTPNPQQHKDSNTGSSQKNDEDSLLAEIDELIDKTNSIRFNQGSHGPRMGPIAFSPSGLQVAGMAMNPLNPSKSLNKERWTPFSKSADSDSPNPKDHSGYPFSSSKYEVGGPKGFAGVMSHSFSDTRFETFGNTTDHYTNKPLSAAAQAAAQAAEAEFVDSVLMGALDADNIENVQNSSTNIVPKNQNILYSQKIRKNSQNTNSEHNTAHRSSVDIPDLDPKISSRASTNGYNPNIFFTNNSVQNPKSSDISFSASTAAIRPRPLEKNDVSLNGLGYADSLIYGNQLNPPQYYDQIFSSTNAHQNVFGQTLESLNRPKHHPTLSNPNFAGFNDISSPLNMWFSSDQQPNTNLSPTSTAQPSENQKPIISSLTISSNSSQNQFMKVSRSVNHNANRNLNHSMNLNPNPSKSITSTNGVNKNNSSLNNNPPLDPAKGMMSKIGNNPVNMSSNLQNRNYTSFAADLQNPYYYTRNQPHAFVPNHMSTSQSHAMQSTFEGNTHIYHNVHPQPFPSMQALHSHPQFPNPGPPQVGALSTYNTSMDLPLGDLGKGVAASTLPQNTVMYYLRFKGIKSDLYFYRKPVPTPQVPNPAIPILEVGHYVVVEADRGQDVGLITKIFENKDHAIAFHLSKINNSESRHSNLGSDPSVQSESNGSCSTSSTNDQFSPDSQNNQKSDDSTNFSTHSSGLISSNDSTTSGNTNSSSNSSSLSNREIYVKRIFRLADSNDMESMLSKVIDEDRSLFVCQSKIKLLNLSMEVVDAEFQWDRRKLTFFFNAEHRIDFRELVRELFKSYKTRIWMCAVDQSQRSDPNAFSPIVSPQTQYQNLPQFKDPGRFYLRNP
ncbi:hypothetical protein BB560_000006 [Smittium megazygosporum]|uniref:PSP1 C-terminal domain-containing protein n=1 Tax=Smittium megazygosporum TaxID=133381 RepID=A0A2T9ZLH7_9FUNG|nr:hypothetical protein BB560_000006 [Smittium megazygosporum]